VTFNYLKVAIKPNDVIHRRKKCVGATAEAAAERVLFSSAVPANHRPPVDVRLDNDMHAEINVHVNRGSRHVVLSRDAKTRRYVAIV